MNTQDIRISDYNYPLPDSRIAKYPKEKRDTSKLLVYKGERGDICEDIFYNLPKYLPTGKLMVFNNTKVIQARMHFRKETGALIEIFLLEPLRPHDYERMFQSRGICSWLCLVGNLKKWKEGALSVDVPIGDKKIILKASRDGVVGTGHSIRFEWDDDTVSFAELIDACGELPIPPYLNRATEESDLTTYQTVYSKVKGSVAAPTAGLHFTEEVLQAISDCGIERDEVTLHVGAGTFRPVKSETISGHDMHTEHIAVKRSTIQRLIAHGGKAIAVGTTSVRTLESLYYIGCKILEHGYSITEDELHVNQWESYEVRGCEGILVPPYPRTPVPSIINCLQAIDTYMEHNNLDTLHTSTQIIIAPGYEYKIVDTMITNFHQPQSTLLLLVSAFLKGDWRRVYDYALNHDFRFLSYGDSCLLMP